ncbi:Tat (twin-arginine translocation) pathway signal sequence [Verrucomicrobium sp. GAS474]|uniref:MBL fold metallo-hydrolase n=1 Tax=Verrucomicrobium sp. GAS474 TaxID=1882831 RepID=UPI00087D0B97|nr:MBL fold metallo-hydrolase [Verrucomicrobium sp. GAS474]SDT98202.1 Tat (twin-arginine translocation) pathway signal sequence [Verrucomicrobium sp. GAS474]
MATSRRDFLTRAAVATAAAVFLPRFAGYDMALAQPVATDKKWVSQTFRVGAIKVTSFRDGTAALPLRPIMTNAPAGEAEAVMKAAGLPDPVPISFNVLLIEDGTEKILVDTGYGALAGAAAGGLPAALRGYGLAPEKVTAVVLSHAHGDHYGGLLDAATGKLNYPNARLFITQTEYDFWTSGANLSKTPLPADQQKGMIEGSAKALNALAGKWEKVPTNQKIIEGVWLLPAPGHTPGHSALLIASGNEQLLHIVDAAHNHVLMFARPEWTIAFDTDPAQAVATRRRLFDRAAADKLRIMSYHLPFPGTGRIVTEGKGYKWVGEVFTT